MRDYYDILGAEPQSGFQSLKKAYYRRAMECHPDRFGGHPGKAEEFRELVEAFNILSDPLTRARYDNQRIQRAGGVPAESAVVQEDSILDTHADDILEEMIVGNTVPDNTSLQTLLRDLERTERFCLFREAKTLYYQGHFAFAADMFRRYLAGAPVNILAHYYLGRCLVHRRRYRQAAREYAEAVRIGRGRNPPLRLARIRKELDDLRRHRLGVWARLRAEWFGDAEPLEPLPPDEQMRREVSRAMRNVLREERRRRRQLPG